MRAQRTAAIAAGRGLRSALRLTNRLHRPHPVRGRRRRLDPGERQSFTLRVGIRTGARGKRQFADHRIAGHHPPGSLSAAAQRQRQTRLRRSSPPRRCPLPAAGARPARAVDRRAAKDEGDSPFPRRRTHRWRSRRSGHWPTAPRLVAGVTGPLIGRALLTDDDLTGELKSGGRLDQLLATLESVLRPEAGRDSARTGLAASLCLAIDPDLLLTVSAMATGYQVLASPSDPYGPTREGMGAAAAKAWLDRLHTVASDVHGRLAVRAGRPARPGRGARRRPDRAGDRLPRRSHGSVLSIKSLRGITLPDSGSIDAEAATMIAGHGFTGGARRQRRPATESRSAATATRRTDDAQRHDAIAIFPVNVRPHRKWFGCPRSRRPARHCHGPRRNRPEGRDLRHLVGHGAGRGRPNPRDPRVHPAAGPLCGRQGFPVGAVAGRLRRDVLDRAESPAEPARVRSC